MNLDGTCIVITGAASGIGRALLERLATYPVTILAADVQADLLENAVAQLTAPRATVQHFTVDVSSAAGNDALFAEALRTMGRINCFIANAGFAYYESLDTADWARLERMYAVNVFAPMDAAVRMRALNTGRAYRVVITASAMGYIAYPGYALYAGSKAALIRFAEGYRFELSERASLTLVYPISTRTNFFNQAGERTPVSWPTQSAEQVAAAIVRGIEHDQADIHPSRLFWFTLLLDRVLPIRWLIQWLALRDFRAWLGRRHA
jgi:short-subunit dehydrogenase